jgi:hypothetical protein
MTSGVLAIFDAILSPPLVERTCSAQAPSELQSGRSDAASDGPAHQLAVQGFISRRCRDAVQRRDGVLLDFRSPISNQ